VASATPNRLYYAASPGADAFAAKIDPTGTKLLYSTYLGGISNDYGNAIAVDAGGNAYIAGSTASDNFPATRGSFQPAWAGGGPFRDPRLPSYFGTTDYSRGSNAFVAKLDSSGSHLAYASYLGGGDNDTALGVTVDRNGRAVVAGYAKCAQFPAVNDGFVPPSQFSPFATFLSQVAADGSRLDYSTCFGGRGGVVASGVALDSHGNAFLTGLGGSGMAFTPNAGKTGSALLAQLQLPASPSTVISSGGVVDIVSYSTSRISPGSIVSVFGTALTSQTTRAERVPLPVSLSGSSVTIDGIAAPLFYASEGQINLQVPWEIKTGVSQVVVNTVSGSSAPALISVQASAPAILMDPVTERAIAVNQDGTLNSETNPAPAKSLFTLYLIGQGPVSNSPATGVAATASPASIVSSSASIDIGPASSLLLPYSTDIIYLGLTPETVGLAQANIRLPDLPPGEYHLATTIAGVRSNFVFVFIGTP
jgi:uncharacterized protein (TIGR03437 family)